MHEAELEFLINCIGIGMFIKCKNGTHWSTVVGLYNLSKRFFSVALIRKELENDTSNKKTGIGEIVCKMLCSILTVESVDREMYRISDRVVVLLLLTTLFRF
jgi:hypothetical protein